MLHNGVLLGIAITVGALCVLTVRCCQGGVERASSDRPLLPAGAGVPVFPHVPVRISTAVDIRCPTRVSCFVAAEVEVSGNPNRKFTTL